MYNSASDTLNFRPKDRLARLIGIPLVSLSSQLGLHGLHHFDTQLIGELIIDFSFTLSLWEGIRQIWFKLRDQFPLYTQTKIRLIWLICITLAYVFLAVFIIRIAAIYFFGYTKLGFWQTYAVSLVPTVIIVSIYESSFFFWAWKNNIQKTEALARENVQSQLEALKNQLDPHFLFNSLNTLASLIDDDNQPAHTYLEQLADVYRYVLVSSDKDSIPLEQEMTFLNAYIYLNKIRFRENLQTDIQVCKADCQKYIAPLTLQLLVENAIKHNVVSKDNPLTIKIFKEQNYLVVQNNMQEKKTFGKSAKVGLQNIVNRYRLLTEHPVEIISNTDSFTVKIPLL